MPGYHDFVFDKSARQFIGRFEDMYQAEQQDGFRYRLWKRCANAPPIKPCKSVCGLGYLGYRHWYS